LLKEVVIAHVPPEETYLITYLLTPWCRVLLENLTGLGKFVYFALRKLGTGHPKTELYHPDIDLGKPKLASFFRQGETPLFLCGGYL